MTHLVFSLHGQAGHFLCLAKAITNGQCLPFSRVAALPGTFHSYSLYSHLQPARISGVHYFTLLLFALGQQLTTICERTDGGAYERASAG